MSSRQSVPQQESNAKPETVQPSIPEQETVQSDGHVIQRLIGSGAGAPNDPLPNRIQNLPPSQRKQAILQMQRTHGNAYVQRMLNSSPDAIQRAPAHIQRAPAGLQQGIKFAAPEFSAKPDVPIPGIPVKWSEVKIGGEISFSAEEKGDSNTQVGVKGGSDGHAGVYGETVLKEWGKWSSDLFGEISVESKGEAELTTNGGQLALVAGALKIGKAQLSLKFNLISYNIEKTEVEWPNLSLNGEYAILKHEVTTPDGTKLTLEIKPQISYIFTPDYARIGKWLAERYVGQAALGLGAALGILAAGVAAVAPAMVQASLGKEIAGLLDDAVRNTKRFAMGYVGTMQGNLAGGTDNWEQKGIDAAKAVIKSMDLPVEAINEAASKRNLMAEAFGAAWPVVKEEILRQYKEEHWFEMMMYNERHAPGYSLLKQHLDAPMDLHFDRVYVIGQDDYDWIN